MPSESQQSSRRLVYGAGCWDTSGERSRTPLEDLKRVEFGVAVGGRRFQDQIDAEPVESGGCLLARDALLELRKELLRSLDLIERRGDASVTRCTQGQQQERGG